MGTQFVNQVYFDIPADIQHNVNAHSIPEVHEKAILFPDLIPEAERALILSNLDKANWLPVSVTGMSRNYKPGDEIGSYRASNFTQEYTEILWNRIKSAFPDVRELSEKDSTDWDGHVLWRPVGVSPLLRFIKYKDGGWLVAHYDSPFIENAERRTLSSLVIYLDKDPNISGGATRYMFDPEPGVPVEKRNLADWSRGALEHEVRYPLTPEAGTGIVFDHRLFHDAEKVYGSGCKTIIRTDILYEKVYL